MLVIQLQLSNGQGACLGTALVTRLVAEARSRDIECLRTMVLPDNDVVLAMFAKHAPSVAIERHGRELHAAIPTGIAQPVARAAAFR